MADNTTDIMSVLREKQYQFEPTRLERLIHAYGGRQVLALDIGCSERTLYRAIRNQTRNPRLQKDILVALGVTDPRRVGTVAK